MSKKVKTGLIVCMGLILVVMLILSATQSFAQQNVKRAKKVTPVMRDVARICTKADLAQWQANLPLGPKGEFPFEGSCKTCYQKLGAMNLPSMSVWIINKGQSNAPASKAKLTWHSAKPPYGQLTATANVPAMPAGDKQLITVNVPSNSFFQTAKPITMELDSQKQVDECNENNNTMTYNYH